jgi:GntR family transcriptional regulator
MNVEIILSQTDGRPMYLQIIEQVSGLVLSNQWPEGYKIPSIRELAVGLKVSVITVKRAYQELEAQGVIVTQQGKGSFISSNPMLNSQLQELEMDKHLIEALKIAKQLGLDLTQLQTRLHEIEQQTKQGDE